MIRDVTEFRRTGVASRRVTELDIPVAAWRAAMCHAGRLDRARVRTFLLPPTSDADDPRDQLVFAVRTDPPPDPAVQQQGLLSWWRIDELNMPFGRWRAALHRIARKDHVRVHTFRVPPTVPGRDDDPDQLVYAFWIDPTDPRQTSAASPARPPAAHTAPPRSPATRPAPAMRKTTWGTRTGEVAPPRPDPVHGGPRRASPGRGRRRATAGAHSRAGSAGAEIPRDIGGTPGGPP